MTADLPSYRTRFVQLAALWAYGVGQPLYAVIDGNPELVLSRNLSRPEIAMFALVVAIVPPALAIAYVRLASRVSAWVGDVLFLAVLGAFLVPLAARVAKPIDAGPALALTLVAALCGAGIVAYTRSRAVRLFLTYSIVLPLAALVWFVNGAPSVTGEAKAADVRVSSPTPVVMLVLDEMPASSLMTRDGALDSIRYPNFARLARGATWYPNATTVHEWTSDAVPSILTGRVGNGSTLPTVDNYPENLFTLLAETYALDVREGGTRLCPETYCPQPHRSPILGSYDLFVDGMRLVLSRSVPHSLSSQVIQVNFDIGLQKASDASLVGLEQVAGDLSLTDDAKRVFYSHVILPHAPWRFLPSGDRYDPTGMDGWHANEHWGEDPWPVLQGYQRHLLQVGYTDRRLGQLLRRLRTSGLYDRSLLVVVADHGVSFRAGQGRRPLTGDNLADITNVPLFVKFPHERHGRIDRRPARTIDVLPTIADVLGIRLPWKVDGTTLRGPLRGRRGVVVGLRGGKTLHATMAAMIRDRRLTLERKFAAFGQGRDSLYRIGRNTWLLGRHVSNVVAPTSTVEVGIDDADALSNVRRSSGFVPARIFGHVTKGRVPPGVELAIAVNGRVEALTRCLAGDGPQRFRALVPESALHDGRNLVAVYLIRDGGGRASLVRVGST